MCIPHPHTTLLEPSLHGSSISAERPPHRCQGLAGLVVPDGVVDLCPGERPYSRSVTLARLRMAVTVRGWIRDRPPWIRMDG